MKPVIARDEGTTKFIELELGLVLVVVVVLVLVLEEWEE
jgi:hypothetical protein